MMSISQLSVAGYRSVRDLRLKISNINVVTGPNGCGKSNLYRAIYLLHAAATGELARTLAVEGGMPSVLWAGARTKGPVRMTLGVTFDQFAYELSCGLPIPSTFGPGAEPSAFILDPHVKEEKIWLVEKGKRLVLMERDHATARARDDQGNRVTYPMIASDSESVLTELREPEKLPILSAVRQELRAWRFYHRFRTDPESPLRQPQLGVRTPALSHDGIDLAAALQTIREIGDHRGLQDAVNQAFPGAEARVEYPEARFSVYLKMPEFKRPFSAPELSDGTLHYLCLIAALLSPRPPSLLVINEPESSLHPGLIEPLARLIVRASLHSQIWITTHSQSLASQIQHLSGTAPILLDKINGETQAVQRGDE